MNNDYIFKAFIVNTAEYNNGNRETSGLWLSFPTTKENVSELFKAIGLPNDAGSHKYFIDEYDYNYDSANYDIVKSLPMCANIDELNYLAYRISEMEPMDAIMQRKTAAVYRVIYV